MRVPHQERKGYNLKDGTRQNLVREIVAFLEKKLLWRSPASIKDVLKAVFLKTTLKPANVSLFDDLRLVLENVRGFFTKTNEQRGTRTLLLRDSVRSILSGPSTQPLVLRNLLSSTTSKISQFEDAQIRREEFDQSYNVNDLMRVNVYLKKKKRIPIRVKCQIINFAEKWCFQDPSVEKFIDWNDPREPGVESISHARY